jgi:type IV pilus assembly protein PilO
MRFGFREAIFLLVLLAVPVVAYFYLFRPENAEIATALEEIEVKQVRLDTLEKITSRIDDLGLAIEEGRESIARLDAKLPDEQDVEGILEQVWQIARSNHLTVKKVKSEKPVPASLYRELPLAMVLEGQFDGFYQFLLELESLPRITRIHEMKLERANTRAASSGELPPGAMRAEFTLSIYFKPSDLADAVD